MTDIDEAAIRARAENTRIPNITPRGDINDLLSLLDAARRERDEAMGVIQTTNATMFAIHRDRDALRAALEPAIAHRKRAETDGVQAIMYWVCAEEYLDAAIAAVQAKEKTIERTVAQERDDVICWLNRIGDPNGLFDEEIGRHIRILARRVEEFEHVGAVERERAKEKT